MRTSNFTQAVQAFPAARRTDLAAFERVNPQAARGLSELFDQFDRLYPELAETVPAHQAATMLEELRDAVGGAQLVRGAVRGACMRALDAAGLPVDLAVTRAELDSRDYVESIEEAAGYLATALGASLSSGEETDDGPTIDAYSLSLSVNADDSSIYTVESLICGNGPTVYVSYSSSTDLIKFTYHSGSSCIELETDGIVCGLGGDTPLRAALIEYAEVNC